MAKRISLSEFLSGTPLRYKGYGGRTHFATFTSAGQPAEGEIGIIVKRKDKVVGIAAVRERKLAAAFYHNVTRRNPSGDDEDEGED